ncbi:sensor histidine kinase [Singulisphaera sp. PoT]|uniref:sensor histidine kinase n=1 Tax=Singulisphaera sp. PoT TaxID=3411797 RepID=UPI003BF5DD03
MLTRSLLLRIAGPSFFMSLLFLGSCLTASVYLHYRQSTSIRELDENLRSRRIATDLLLAIDGLSGANAAAVEASERRIGDLIGRARKLADRPEEARLVDRLEASFARHLRSRRDDPRQAGNRDGSSLVVSELVPICRELERFNSGEVDRSEGSLRRTVTWTAWGLASVGLVGAAAGAILGYIVARRLGRNVLRAESLAEVGQVAAGLAHELRNPLTAIKMLVQANLEDAESQDLRVIELEIRRMEDRLNVFIDFARPPRPERRILDLNTVVDQTLALVGGRARKQRVVLHFEPPPSPIEVEADGEQLRQLLVNLALNALDVMPRGGELDVEIRPTADGHVEVIVLDTGPGIPARHFARLYEPFFTTKETGLGLGLPVSQRIAHDHGGMLCASNRPQGGARFMLRMPALGGSHA